MLINAYGTRKRMAMSLQVEDLDAIGEEINQLLQIAENVPTTMLGKVKLLPRLAELSSFFPRMVKSGVCQEVVSMDPDLDQLPILNAGRRMGDGLLPCRRSIPAIPIPASAIWACIVYRCMTSKRLECTGICIMTEQPITEHPRKWAGILLKWLLPWVGIRRLLCSHCAPASRYRRIDLCRLFAKKPVDMVRCKTIDMEVPADAEIVSGRLR